MSESQSNPKIDLQDNLPWGMCILCLERMAKGAAYEAVTLPSGRQFVHAYCAHREAGATLLIGPNRPKRWSILIPIGIEDWIKFLELRVPMLAGALEVTDSTDAEKP